MSYVSAPKVLLILGSGPRIGKSVAAAFVAKGYKIALAARSLDERASTPGQLNIKADFADSQSISSIFAKVKEELGLPTVVIYNASSRTLNDPTKPLEIPLEDVRRNFAVNTFSVIEATREAVSVFEQLPPTAPRTFIYTGNYLNEVVFLPAVGYGMTKAATAQLIHAASKAYKDKGFRFYYADERKEDGRAAIEDVSGEAAAEFYLELAEGKGDVPWQATHVKGVGYVHFDRRTDP